MPLYVTTNVIIKPNWQGLIELVLLSGNYDYKSDNFEEISHPHNVDKVEEIIEENCGETLVQNILHFKQIIDDDSKTLTIALAKGFQPLGLSLDSYSKEYNFQMLFHGNPSPSFTCSYQKIVQVELTNVNKKFAYHITNIYFKNQNFNTFYIIFYMNLYVKRKIM